MSVFKNNRRALLSHVEHLINNGIDIKLAMYNLEINIFDAIRYGNKTIVKYLIKSGINPDIKDFPGYTVLEKLCQYDCANCIKFLIKKGTKINLTNRSYEILFALGSNHSRCIKLLLNMGIDINIKYYNKPILLIASENKHINSIKILLKNGVDIYTKEVYGLTTIETIKRVLHSLPYELDRTEYIDVITILQFRKRYNESKRSTIWKYYLLKKNKK